MERGKGMKGRTGGKGRGGRRGGRGWDGRDYLDWSPASFPTWLRLCTQWGFGRSPSRNRIGCILALKYDIWWHSNDETLSKFQTRISNLQARPCLYRHGRNISPCLTSRTRVDIKHNSQRGIFVRKCYRR